MPLPRPLRAALLLALLTALGLPLARAAFAQNPPPTPSTDAYAEALQQANVRAGPAIEFEVIGEIRAGTRCRVLAQHALYPWLLIELPGGSRGWVYRDLVTVTGDLSGVPWVSATDPIATPAATQTAAAPVTPATTPPPAVTPTATLAMPTLTPTLAGAVATTLNEVNVRFGPGVEYPIVATAPPGASYLILERHTLVPWLRVAIEDSPTGSGWLFSDIVEVSGDLASVPATSAATFGYPTLTPTPQTVTVGGAAWQAAPTPLGALAGTLGEQLQTYLLKEGFDPYTRQLASVFVLDLTTGDTFTLNPGVAYSGMSLTKIPILAAYFARHSGPLSRDEAFLIADTMMCSENLTTNELLTWLGDGDALTGAQRVTAFLQQLGLRRTFLMRQYVVRPDETPVAVGTLDTEADQQRALPDAYNQIVVEELGWLLAGMYQCALDGSGLLTERLPDAYTVQECRQMLYAMDANAIGVFLEAGVPEGARVIHKHGWIADTHGDAGLVIGPQGAFVFVAALYGRDWLEFEHSSPVIAELARMTWNALNPQQIVPTIHEQTVPATCDPWSDPVMAALLSSSALPMIGSGQ